MGKPITDKDIDHYIQQMGIRLQAGQERLRKQVLYTLQLKRDKEDAHLNQQSVPMYLFDWKQ